MTHTVTIESLEPDAMPFWESFDHTTVDAAYAAARDHIAAAQPADRIVDHGGGVYAVLSAAAGHGSQRVATVVITSDDDTSTAPTTPNR